MKFKSKKNMIFRLITLFFCGISGIIIYRIFSIGINVYEFKISELLLFLSTFYIIWIYFGTRYELTKTELIYKSGLLRGKINIQNITKIETDKIVWYGIRPATAISGILIKYKKYDDIFLSPKDEDKFILNLLKLNERIKVEEG